MSKQQNRVHPASTVVILKQKTNCPFELLLLRRNKSLSFHGGAWVFPGGRIDPIDYQKASSQDEMIAARYAAVRETYEEAGISIQPDQLILFSRWTTPPGMHKRFKTWFFVTSIHQTQIMVDGSEIQDYEWYTPIDAIHAHRMGKIKLPIPTYVTIEQFIPFTTVEEVLQTYQKLPPTIFD